MEEITFCQLREVDIPEIVSAFHDIGWNKPDTLYNKYLMEQKSGDRNVLVARLDGLFAGYGTIKWVSEYPGLQKNNTPEISDLNVLPKFQRGQFTEISGGSTQ